jgi:hypothetical protein
MLFFQKKTEYLSFLEHIFTCPMPGECFVFYFEKVLAFELRGNSKLHFQLLDKSRITSKTNSTLFSTFYISFSQKQK